MLNKTQPTPDFRLPTAAKWRAPQAVADGSRGMILAIAEVAGSPEQAFRALTTNEVEEWWKFPGVYRLKDWKADLRAGGRWSVTVELNDGNAAHHWGEFCELDFPNKIVMTSRSDAHPLLGERETTITYRLEPIAGGTRLTVRDEGFIGRADAAYGNAENWERVLGWLAAYIGAAHQVDYKPQIVSDASWLAARKKLLAKEKAFNRLRDDRDASQTAYGEGREGLCIRWAARSRDSPRPFRRTASADRVSLHVRPGSGRRLQALFFRDGQHRGKPDPSLRQRDVVCGRLARPCCQARGVQATNAVDLSLGFVLSQRLQLRLPCHVGSPQGRLRAQLRKGR